MPDADEHTRISRVLDQLKQGQPIGRDRLGLIRQAAPEAIQKFSQRVASDTKSGPQGKTSSIWLIAHYGGGKTQALQMLKGMLGDSRFGEFKVFVPSIDLNFEASSSARGLQLALFENASSLAPQAPTVKASDSEDELVSMGLEFLEEAVGDLPFGTTFLKRLFVPAKRQLYRWTDWLRRSVEQKWKFSDPRAVELMTRWMRYSIFPDSNSVRQAFTSYQQELAEKGALFPVLTHILRASGYASMVILIDQVEKLVDKPSLTDALMTIYAPESNAGLNLFFVFAGTGDVTGLDNETVHGGFPRRFRDAKQCSTAAAVLGRPIIDSSEGNDIDRIKAVLDRLKQQTVGLELPEFDAPRMNAIRAELSRLAEEGGGAVSWPMVWRVMLGERP